MGRSTPTFNALGASLCGDGLQNPADDAVAHQHDLRIFGLPLFRARFALLRHAVLRFQIADCALRDHRDP